MNNEQRIAQLEHQVQELLTWKEQRIRQQLVFPLDKISTDIIQKDLFVVNDFVVYTRPNGVVTPYAYVGSVNSKPATISALDVLHPMTADASSNVITSANHGFVDDVRVSFISSDTLPAGITDGIGYYVINATVNTFKISTTSGGSAVDITDAGVGKHYAYYF